MLFNFSFEISTENNFRESTVRHSDTNVGVRLFEAFQPKQGGGATSMPGDTDSVVRDNTVYRGGGCGEG